MKDIYEPIEMEVINIDSSDIIITSGGDDVGEL